MSTAGSDSARGVHRSAIVTCAVCGPEEHTPTFAQRDWFLGLVPGTFDYWRCCVCGTVTQHPMLGAETLASAYDTYHQPLPDKTTGLQRVIERIAQGEADGLARHADLDAPVVDVGCGAGAFLRRLGRAGWRGERMGVEPEGDVAEHASAQLGLRVSKGAAEHPGLAHASVGTVVMRHVIEHVRDPGEVLDVMYDAIESGGILYLATPDSRALSARVFNRYWHGWDPPRHLHVFSSDSLRQLVRQHGFEPIDEHWHWSPEMWTASLRHALTQGHDRPRRRRLARDHNPVLLPFAGAAATVEVLTHRSTMYALTARRRGSA